MRLSQSIELLLIAGEQCSPLQDIKVSLRGKMTREKQSSVKKPWGRIVICSLLLLCAVICFFFLRHVTQMLSSEQAAARWGADVGRFAQVTAFLPEHEGLPAGASAGIPMAINGAIREQGLTAHVPEGGFSYAYAASPIPLQVSSRDRGEAAVFATGVGGNFFLFQSVQLISGAFLPVESVNRDYVLIDETLAWYLFGAVDVAGMEVFINHTPYIISGVYRPNRDFASRAAYADRPHLFFFYDTPTMFSGAPITMVTAVLPNPLTGLAEEMFREALDGLNVNEDGFVLVDNTRRYTIPALFRVIRGFGTRSMYQTGLRLPYWENAARMAEDFAALALVLFVLFLLFPLFCGVQLLVRRWRRRKWRTRDAWERLDQKREARREEKWRQEQGLEDPAPEIESDQEYDLEEIIRSVRESEEEENDETEI